MLGSCGRSQSVVRRTCMSQNSNTCYFLIRIRHWSSDRIRVFFAMMKWNIDWAMRARRCWVIWMLYSRRRWSPTVPSEIHFVIVFVSLVKRLQNLFMQEHAAVTMSVDYHEPETCFKLHRSISECEAAAKGWPNRLLGSALISSTSAAVSKVGEPVERLERVRRSSAYRSLYCQHTPQ